MLSEFGRLRNLATDFLFGLGCVKAGIPALLIAPPSGGKTTLIYTIHRYLEDNDKNVMLISRLGLRGLKKLARVLNYVDEFNLLNEDYALIGSSDYMAEKIAEIVGALSYSGTYYDYGLEIRIALQKLGFLSGVQPYWLRRLMTKPAYITHIREKFIRYYMLPYTPSRDVEMKKAIIELLMKYNRAKKNIMSGDGYTIPREFIRALASQVGMVRAKEYAERLGYALSEVLGSQNVHRAMKFYAQRIGFEDNVIRRDLTEEGYKVQVMWREYTALYWALRKGRLTREEMRKALGVTSIRSADRLIEEGIYTGWITTQWVNGIKYVIPNPELRELLRW